MKREELEHVLRAAAEICAETPIVVIGSQSILGAHPEATESVLITSMEADLYPLHAPEKSQALNAIGWGSPFHDMNGYYADGVDDKTAVLPPQWLDRVIAVDVSVRNDAKVRGLCLDPHDLAVSKLVAGRDKDIEFVRAAARCGYITKARVSELFELTSVAATLREVVRVRIETAFGA